MKEAIGGTWILGIVIVFIVLFTSYLALSVNYSKAFKVKNKVIEIIEENEGLTSDAQTKITQYLNDVGYFVYGPCNREQDTDDLLENGYGDVVGCEKKVAAANTQKYKYCVATRNAGNDDILQRKYYKVTVFFKFDLPLFDEVFTFPVTGETKAVYFAKDSDHSLCS